MSRAQRERGTVLLVSLILLIVATTISLSAVSTSVMELRMAGNAEASVDTMQTALAAVDFAIADPSNLPVSGPLKVPTTVTLSDTMFNELAGETITASASRIEDCAPPPRMRAASSLLAYSSFKYEISAEINRNVRGMGQSGVAQGYLQMGPKC